MTSVTMARRPQGWTSALRDDARQLIAVLALAAIALLLGFGLRLMSEGQTRSIEAQGVTVAIPAGWVYAPGAGDLALTVQDPRDATRRYSVSRLTTPGLTPAQAADRQTAAKSQFLERFAVLERTTVTIGGRESQRVRYVHVTDGPGRIPQVVAGLDDYIAGDGTVLVISVEATARGFDRQIPEYERFAASVRD